MINRILAYTWILLTFVSTYTYAQEHSIAREWNEEILNAIRNDFARPTVHARNLWHSSVAMYDIWAVHDPVAEPYFLGRTVGGFEFPFEGIPESSDPEADIEEAISFAIYRLMFNRFLQSPGAGNIIGSINQKMIAKGYNLNNQSRDYQSGDPAALGNYFADLIIAFGRQDNSNQQGNYQNLYYQPVNEPMIISRPGAGDIVSMNNWQPLTLTVFIDQSGNEIPGSTPPFLSPEWGKVTAFALSPDDLTIYDKNGDEYYVYHDPGDPPYTSETDLTDVSEEYKWGFSLVSIWSSHLDTADQVFIDISPASFGNLEDLPETIFDYKDFYNLFEGGTGGMGHDLNPVTGMPYEPNIVRRGDYGRILAEFWADGPDSETPPGHWFTILNYVTDHQMFEQKYRGIGERLSNLEWDVKAYMVLGGAMHDCAVTAWGIKGYYDYIRPVSAIRAMADKGQSSDPSLPNYHPAGFKLIDGYIELVDENDPLVGPNNENLNKIKIYAWRGPDFIDDPEVDHAGVGWILAESWWPYQRPSFVTPPFAGYISGHSTFSRAAADVLTAITGDEYFPGGMGEFLAPKNEFLVFEEGPTEDVILQWATYRDASDQTSLSRIWGGIHPPADDIPGRKIGVEIAEDAVALAEQFFFKDEDNDGFYNYIDCDDLNAQSYPGAPEVCDGMDNDCDGEIDNGLPEFTYYLDSDNDGFGDGSMSLDTCLAMPPLGYVANSDDCNDQDEMINPSVAEICDGIDNDCTGFADDGLPTNRYYLDSDNDGFGDDAMSVDTCILVPPVGYVSNNDDCNDQDEMINPSVAEVCDGIDNDCSGFADDGLPTNRYYLDSDNDGFGDNAFPVDTCIVVPPVGYVSNNDDCNDQDNMINPTIAEICDGIDNDCSGFADDGLPKNRYYQDLDLDGYGNEDIFIDTCLAVAPALYSPTGRDCDDNNNSINPGEVDIPDNGIDEDCSGLDLFKDFKTFPNPFTDELTIHLDYQNQVRILVYSRSGQVVYNQLTTPQNNRVFVRLDNISEGVHYLKIVDSNYEKLFAETIVKL